MTDKQSSELNTCEDWLLIEDYSSSSNLEQNSSECSPVSDTQAVISNDLHSFESSSEDREQIASLNSGVENVDIIEDSDDDFLDCNLSNLDPLGDENVLFTLPTVRCYKHCRNERWNFMLNLIVTITVAAAFAFASGHFLGWSHKCTEMDRKFSSPKMFQNLDGIMRNKLMERLHDESPRKLSSPQNVWTEIPKLQSDCEDKVLVEKMCFEKHNHTEKCFPKMLPLNSITEPTPLSPEPKEKVSRNHRQNSSVYEQIILHPNNAKDSAKNTELLFNKSDINSHNSEKGKSIFNFTVFKEFHDEIKFEIRNRSYIIDNLKQDFKYIVNLLNSMSVAFLSKTAQSNTDIEMISEIYSSFEISLNSKLSDLQLKNSSSNSFHKTNSKYFKKQILNLLDAVKSLLKTNTKILKKYYGRFNLEKFSRSISKIIYDLENKWNKNSKFYKDKDNEENHKKSGKPIREFAKQDKKKQAYFKDSHKYTYKSKNFPKKYK